MKHSARRYSEGLWTAFGLRGWALAVLALATLDSFWCSGGSPNSFVASGEQALIGSYKLDHAASKPGANL